MVLHFTAVITLRYSLRCVHVHLHAIQMWWYRQWNFGRVVPQKLAMLATNTWSCRAFWVVVLCACGFRGEGPRLTAACTTIIVGKSASADGSTMCTHNADVRWLNPCRHIIYSVRNISSYSNAPTNSRSAFQLSASCWCMDIVFMCARILIHHRACMV